MPAVKQNPTDPTFIHGMDEGKPRGYWKFCRCDSCRQAVNVYQDERKKASRKGGHIPVPRGPRKPKEDISATERDIPAPADDISDTNGPESDTFKSASITEKLVSEFPIDPDWAAKLAELRVKDRETLDNQQTLSETLADADADAETHGPHPRPTNPTMEGRTAATGASRRMQGLAWMGYTPVELAHYTQISVDNIWWLLFHPPMTVKDVTHKIIRDKFLMLRDQPKTTHAGAPGWGPDNVRTRELAEQHGWAGPYAWDDVAPDAHKIPVNSAGVRALNSAGVRPETSKQLNEKITSLEDELEAADTQILALTELRNEALAEVHRRDIDLQRRDDELHRRDEDIERHTQEIRQLTVDLNDAVDLNNTLNRIPDPREQPTALAERPTVVSQLDQLLARVRNFQDQAPSVSVTLSISVGSI